MKRLSRIVLVILSLFLLTTGVQLQAQDDGSITVIPFQSEAYSIAVSPDSRLIATTENSVIHNDEVLLEYLPIRVFDSDTGEEIFTLEGFTDYAGQLAFNDDSSVLASYHAIGWIYLWDMTTGEMIRQIPAIPNASFIHFVPGTNLLVQAIQNGLLPSLLVWNTDTGAIDSVVMNRFETQFAFRNYIGNSGSLPEPITALQVLPDGETVLASTAMNDVFLWNFVTNERNYLVTNTEDRRPYFDIRSIAMTPEGILYPHTRDELLRFLNTSTGEETTLFEGRVHSVASASDADVIAWLGGGRDDLTLYITSLNDPTKLEEVPLASINPTGELALLPGFSSVVVSADGTKIIVGGFINRDGSDNGILVLNNG